jgi:hypothetical protein
MRARRATAGPFVFSPFLSCLFIEAGNRTSYVCSFIVNDLSEVWRLRTKSHRGGLLMVKYFSTSTGLVTYALA